MFEKNQEIHFSCTQCGKCCEKSPNVSFYEMLELSDRFIFQTAHHTMISYAQKPLDKSLALHYQEIGHTIMMPELDSSLFYFIDFIPIELPSHKQCSQLKNNLCEIYGKRPNICRTNPISPFYDEEDQWKTINFFKEKTASKQWQCSFEQKDPIIYNDGKIQSHILNSLYNQQIINIREITDKYIEFLSLQGDERKTEHFKTLFNAMQKNALVITDVIFMLQAAIYFNIIGQDSANHFIQEQKNLIEKELLVAQELKNKENLQTSRLYKKIIIDYNKVIDTKLFNQPMQDDFGII